MSQELGIGPVQLQPDAVTYWCPEREGRLKAGGRRGDLQSAPLVLVGLQKHIYERLEKLVPSGAASSREGMASEAGDIGKG